jgi:hypothetical protein
MSTVKIVESGMNVQDVIAINALAGLGMAWMMGAYENEEGAEHMAMASKALKEVVGPDDALTALQRMGDLVDSVMTAAASGLGGAETLMVS